MPDLFMSKIKQTAQRFLQILRDGWYQVSERFRSFADAVSGRVRPGSKTMSSQKKVNNVRRVNTSGPQKKATDTLSQLISQREKKKTRPIRRRSRQRVYRLQGYTTVSKINSRRKSENRQRFLRELLLILIIIVVVIILFQIYNPFRDLSEWYRIIGIDSLEDLAGQTTTTQTIQTIQ